MFKQIYSTPSVRIVEICSESAFLTTSNPYYHLDWDEDDNEFTGDNL